MHLSQFSLQRMEINDTMHQVGKMTVWLPYGWWGRLLLAGVSGPEFHLLRQAARTEFRLLSCTPSGEEYNFANELACVGINSPLVMKYVKQGALWEPRVMAELGKKLEDQVIKAVDCRR